MIRMDPAGPPRAWVAGLLLVVVLLFRGPVANANAAWWDVIDDAAFTRQGLIDLNRSDFQYYSLGLGGTTLRVAPHGFTTPRAPGLSVAQGNLQYYPYLAYQYWWDENGHRLIPFQLEGGYGAPLQPGTIMPVTLPGESGSTNFRQHLDIADGLLTIELGLGIGASRFVSRRSLFITPEGVLVVRVEDSPQAPHPFRLNFGSNMSFSVTGQSQSGVLVVHGTRAGAAEATLGIAVQTANPFLNSGTRTIGASLGGDAVTFYIAPGSSYETHDPAAHAYLAAQAAAQKGYDALLEETRGWWRQFYNRSSVRLPDAHLMRWYARSLYYHGVFFGNTAIPPGAYGSNPTIYWGVVWPEFDLPFSQFALLYTNHYDEARHVADWIYDLLPKAREYARGFCLHQDCIEYETGAKYGWAIGHDGTIILPPADWEGQNLYSNYPNANSAAMALAYADWTGDSQALGEALEILKDTTVVAVADLQYQPGYAAFVDKRAPHALQQMAVAYGIKESVARGVAEPGWAAIDGRVFMPNTLYNGRRVILNRAGEEPSVGYGDAPWLQGLWWYHVLAADNPIVRPTFDMIAESTTGNYIFNRGSMSVYASKLRDGEAAYQWAYSLTEAAIIPDDTNLIEMIYAWDDYKRTPEIAAHGALVCAVTQMLLDPDHEDELTVFPALPAAWREAGVAFADLTARGNLAVSAEFTQAQVTVRILNRNTAAVTKRLRVRLPDGIERLISLPLPAVHEGGWARIESLTLQPGQQVELTFRGGRVDAGVPPQVWNHFE